MFFFVVVVVVVVVVCCLLVCFAWIEAKPTKMSPLCLLINSIAENGINNPVSFE